MTDLKLPPLSEEFQLTSCGIRFRARPFRHRGTYGRSVDPDIYRYNISRFFLNNGQRIDKLVGPRPASISLAYGHGTQGIVFPQQVTNDKVAERLNIPAGSTAVGKLTDSIDDIELSKFLLARQTQANYNFSRPTPSMVPRFGAVIEDTSCRNVRGRAAYIVREDVFDFGILKKYYSPWIVDRLRVAMIDQMVLNTKDLHVISYVNPNYRIPMVMDLGNRLNAAIELIDRSLQLLGKVKPGGELASDLMALPDVSKFMSPLKRWRFLGEPLRDRQHRKDMQELLMILYQYYCDLFDLVNYSYNHSFLMGDFNFTVDNIGFRIEELPTYQFEQNSIGKSVLALGPKRRRLRFIARDIGNIMRLFRPKNATMPAGSSLLFGPPR
jgi:hypothetical protein